MPVSEVVSEQLSAIPNSNTLFNAALSSYTRFGIGGPAAVLVDTAHPEAFLLALDVVRSAEVPNLVIGGGTNLVVSDDGFDGVVLRYRGREIRQQADVLKVDAGAVLQDVVDFSIDAGLRGLQTMTGIPGYLGGAVYGNAGAYGHSIDEIVLRVHATDGQHVFTLDNDQCEFSYRESIFKSRKDWVILWAEMRFQEGERCELAHAAQEIRSIRDAKYPPSMKCAGSIFKNLYFARLPRYAQNEVPPNIIREGKVASAWFLEQTGVKGMRVGDIQVASYHANLIYNDGAGTAKDLVAVVGELKRRVRERFGLELEEEVQYVGLEQGLSQVIDGKSRA